MSAPGNYSTTERLCATAAAVIGAVVVGAEDQDDDRRLDLRPQLFQQQIFLIGAVTRNARRQNLAAR